MPLERRDLVDRAVAPLARRYGFEPDTVREMLANSNGGLERLLTSSGQPETRQQVNRWWKDNRAQFQELGLGVLLRVSSPSKLPPDTYQQLVCLSWLTREMIRRRFAEARVDLERFRSSRRAADQPMAKPESMAPRVPVTTPCKKHIPVRLWLGRRLARQIWHWLQSLLGLKGR